MTTIEQEYTEVEKKFFDSMAEHASDRLVFKKHADGKWEVTASTVTINNILPKFLLEELPVSFNIVNGDFTIESRTLKTLKGFPATINGNFNLLSCKIETMEHCPTKITGIIFLHALSELKSLKGLPTVVNEFKLIDMKKLESLKGCPTAINGDCSISNIPNLESLKYGPEIVHGSIFIGDTTGKKEIDNLDWLPHKIDGDINISILPRDKNYLRILDTLGIRKVKILGQLELSRILTKYAATQDIAKAQQELEKAGLGEYAEY